MRLPPGFWWPLAACLITVAVGIGAGLQPPEKKSKVQLSIEKIAARDPRVEAAARAICAARGIDPDYQGFPYPPGMPVWMTFVEEARDFLAVDDAATTWAAKHAERRLPPND